MKNILVFITVLLFLVSCEDELLNISPISEVTTENFYQSESDMNSALIAVYNGLQDLNHTNWRFQEVRSDNAYAHREEGSYHTDNFTLTQSDNYVADYWQMSYNTIFRTNILLEKIDAVDMLQDRKNLIIGQAKFIRALVYFDLVRVFGEVPVVTSVLPLSEAPDVNRAPVSEVYQLITSDLTDAASLLPASYESSADLGRATKGAANALLGKVYLTTGEFASAKTALNQVISSNLYDLVPNYADIFSIDNQNNEEIIFAIQYSDGTGNGNSFNYFFAPLTAGVDVNPGTGLGFSRPTAELIRAYEDGDTRKQATLSPYEINPATSDTSNLSYFRKFLADQQIRDGGQDWPILRYADVLLMYAEILNEEGDLSGAIDQLNEVRLRGFAGDNSKLYSPAEITSGAEFLDAVLHERRVEFGCENQRWFDLLRFNRAEEFLATEIRSEDYISGQDLIIFPTNMQEYQRLFPLPYEEIELHTNMQQNPGYN